jgi:hypothetical protein
LPWFWQTWLRAAAMGPADAAVMKYTEVRVQLETVFTDAEMPVFFDPRK